MFAPWWEVFMRLRFILFFLFLLGGLACKALAVEVSASGEPEIVSLEIPTQEEASSFQALESPSEEKVRPSWFAQVASKLRLRRVDFTSPSDEYRLYFHYLERVKSSLLQKWVKLDSISFPPPMAALQGAEECLEACDCSRCFFDCFKDSFRDVKGIIDSLQGNPAPYLRPLLELARLFYDAAREAAGVSCCPLSVERRGIPSDVLEQQVEKWNCIRSKLDSSRLSLEGRRVVNGVVRVIQCCMDCAEQFNNQRTRREVTVDDIQFMERILARLIVADQALGEGGEGR